MLHRDTKKNNASFIKGKSMMLVSWRITLLFVCVVIFSLSEAWCWMNNHVPNNVKDHGSCRRQLMIHNNKGFSSSNYNHHHFTSSSHGYNNNNNEYSRLFGSSDSSSSSSSSGVEEYENGVRLNKCFRSSHSRRQADALIEAGRVNVNGKVGTPGQRVFPGKDIVTLDGKSVNWEELNVLLPTTPVTTNSSNNSKPKSQFSYIKYWKPSGVTCTTDLSIPSNIIDELQHSPQAGTGTGSYDKYQKRSNGFNPRNRVFTVGRLDKDSSGLIFLTSDGRLPNAISRSVFKRPKIYQVKVDYRLKESDLQQWRDGVVITTVSQRDGQSKPLTAKTQPCEVQQTSHTEFEITLMEGRNRQIRRMCDVLGYRVRDLHRIEVTDITLERLTPGSWDYLSPNEMTIINNILETYDPHHSTQETYY